MSRAKHTESLHAVQLFPFVAVLLCTMGSLLVLLVSVARSSKERGAVEAVAAQAEARAAVAAKNEQDEEAARLELGKIAKYQAELDEVRGKAAEQLRTDQLKLSHLEDHMRRMREQLESLQLAAAELNSLAGEHIDDRKQAEQEIKRLEDLIADSLKSIEQLRAEAKARAKSYAIMPYEGKNGTFRRPIYIECTEHQIVIQPEGIVFTIDDFQPPIGPGNPLVAALRAAREHIVHYESNPSAGKEAEPYPLIIVRPDGIDAYYHVREAIQSWDSEFGYELVEQDWELKYYPADPQLAVKEHEAAELARGRLRALAAAAPQAFAAYRPGSPSGGGRRSFARGGNDGGPGGGLGGAGGPGREIDEDDYELAQLPAGGAPRLASRPGIAVVPVDRDGSGQPVGAMQSNEQGGARGTSSSSSTAGSQGLSDDRYAVKNDPAATKSPGMATTAPATSQGAKGAQRGPQSQSPQDIERQPSGAPVSGAYSAGEDAEEELDELAREAAAGEDDPSAARQERHKPRGKNWAIANRRPGTIPIRRAIQIVVRNDALAILPEASPTSNQWAAGHEFRFGESPDVAYEELVSAVEKRIREWGIAGDGLSWRPVVELKVTGDGGERVDELMQHLQYGGLEVQHDAVAQHVEGGAQSESH